MSPARKHNKHTIGTRGLAGYYMDESVATVQQSLTIPYTLQSP